jgi:hypothetical protein
VKTIDRIEDIRINADVGLRRVGLFFEDVFGLSIRSSESDTHGRLKRTREFEGYIRRKRSAILLSRRVGINSHNYSMYRENLEQRYAHLKS